MMETASATDEARSVRVAIIILVETPPQGSFADV